MLWNALVTYVIPMVMCYEKSMKTIILIAGTDMNKDEDWSKSIPFTYGPPFEKWPVKYQYIL